MDDTRIEQVYNFRRKAEQVLKRLEESSICTQNKDAIIDFCKFSSAKGIRPSRIHRYVQLLRDCAKILNKPFCDATREDIQKMVLEIERHDYSAWTKRTYRGVIRLFYRWLRNTEEFPEEVRWIKLNNIRNSLSPGDLLTKDEVARMIDAASNLRDKVLIAVLYDSACRPHEILTLRLKDVIFDANGALLVVNGKTGQRTVRIVGAEAILATWFNVHPAKGNPDAPLFPCLARNMHYAYLGYNSFKEIFKQAAAKAGITKRIYPYIFRHSKLTELARSGLVGYHLNLFAGWSLESRMPSTYIHLRAADVDEAILRLNGIRTSGTNQPEFRPITCPRCRQENTPGTKLCYSCGLPLETRFAVEADQRKLGIKEKIDALSDELAKSPEIADRFLEILGLLRDRNEERTNSQEMNHRKQPEQTEEN